MRLKKLKDSMIHKFALLAAGSPMPLRFTSAQSVCLQVKFVNLGVSTHFSKKIDQQYL